MAGGIVPSLSTKFLDVDLKITDVNYHPKEIIVKFQGRYNTEYDFDYHILQSEIQQVSKVKDSVGIGEFCLVEDSTCGEWYRGRVVQKKNHICEVFLMDSGKILAVHEARIASAIDELFQLPPKMVCGIFANILPLEEKWAPKALNYFSSLVDLQIKGHIQAILPHQTFLLDVPKITSDVVELKLGKHLDGDTFRLIVEMLTELPQEPLSKQMPDLLQQKYTRPDSALCSDRIHPDVQPILNSLQPLLTVGWIEKVKISVAVSPSKFYCQLLRYQVDLDKLTASMYSFYKTSRENVPSCDNLGVLCAARRKNGQWQRGVIQQLLSDNKVMIWFMDFGSCEAVPSSSVLKLQPEFISVPRFSFPCALSCLNDQDEAIRNNQLKEFKEALLRQSVVYARIDLFNADEHLYYVTLHKHESGMHCECLPQESDVVPKCYPSFKTEMSCISGTNPVCADSVHRNAAQSGHFSDQKNSRSVCCPLAIPCKRAEIKIDSVCVAYVVYVLNPSNFWVQTNDHLDEFEALMKKIAAVYDRTETDGKILENPEPGKLCCARYSKDMHFYRAVIREVVDSSINVCFLDFGNTETVPLFDVRVLLPEFQEFPALAVCCSLANAFPIEDIWIKKQTDFFKNIVFDKPLTLHAIAKQNNKYIVDVQCMNGSEQTDVLMLMVQAGYAEYWEVKQDPFLNIVRGSQIKHSKDVIPKNNGQKNDKLLKPVTKEPAITFPRCESILSNKYGNASGKSYILRPYKEYRFKPGTVFDVICCHSTSPGDFSCQLRSMLPELDNLMEQIQFYYNTRTIPYESGQHACVAKHSKDGKWYRAAVLQHVSKTEVVVALVDYGYQERVLLKDLQAILPDFLVLECQTFRCCLNRVTESLTFDPYNWTVEACRDFERFVSSSNALLTCSISALILRSPSCLYNVVDLQTPFTTVQQFLVECGHAQFCSFELPRFFIPSFSLYTFYYSTFNMKIGNEEVVCITHIYSPTKFYCQLNRNADVIDKLLKNIAEVSQMASHTDQINICRLCLAKYFGDGLFYRALAYPVGSSDYLPVCFVDFGNKQLVAKVEIIPIPDHASELLFTPMQAVKCYLSDLKDAEIPIEINTWFEKNCLGKELKAVIVSKESDGQLGVELYDKDLQINKKIKELLKHTQKYGVNPRIINRCAEKPVGDKDMVHKVKLGAVKTKVKREVVQWKGEIENETNPCSQSSGKEIVIDLQKRCMRTVKLPTSLENMELVLQNNLGQRCRGTYGELCTDSDNPPLGLKEIPQDNMPELHILKQNPSGQEVSSTTRHKYTNLPQHHIQSDTKILGYISSITSLSSFYIHYAEDESKIVELAEELNGGPLVIEPEPDPEVEEGDTVLAEYETDCCIYRAVVRSIKSEKSFEVEFIDYGNTSTVSASKIYKMEKAFLNLPRLSIHCFLSKGRCVFPDKNWSSDTTAYFVSKVNNQPLMFNFLQKHGQQWEVDVFCHGKSMINELMQREVSLGLQNVHLLNLDQDIKQLPAINADTDSNEQSKKSESQNVFEVFKARPAWENLPKIAYQNIKPGQLEIAEMGHISSDGHFYVKLKKDAEILLNLNVMTDQEARKNSLLEVENIKEGLECLAKSKETLKWYRSQVIEKHVNEGHMLVFFMDLGKYEIVSFHDTQVLSDNIKSIPRTAVPCKWVWNENLGDTSFERVVEIIKCQGIKILFLRYLESAFVWEVDILIDRIQLLEYLNQIPYQKTLENCNLPININVDQTMPKLPFKPNSVPWGPFQNDRYYPGFVTSVTDPSNFCIQLEGSFKALKTLFKLLSDLPENLPAMPQELVVPGASCLIKIGSSEKWNRVEVSEVSKLSNLLTVTFIDDGLSAPIPISDLHKLKVIPEELAKLPRLTYPCSLYGVSPADGEYWSDKAKLQIQEFLGRKGLTFQLKRYHCGLKLEAIVFCEKNNAADLLVTSGYAVYSKTVSSFSSVNCTELHPLNSQILCNPSICDQNIFDARIGLLSDEEKEPQKSGFQVKCTHVNVLRQSSSKQFSCKKKKWQKARLKTNGRNNENQFKCDNSLLNQRYDGEKQRRTYPAGIWSKAVHEMHDLMGTEHKGRWDANL
ncbi:tudor domain-containing protein 15 [Rhineura floridana]|uniref:tudor domain-containing protein 15 n=1 Tax=Rhineura floridana TaxID=261503 RepID=UPI002AC84FFB|nr:tudor domain-containing protein 15 [Rhineura floridana]XP_061478676.1 tudor domain-containing protein 15 [Rhineura floridana]XP_061478677.1 tudor domain-containing protein 15 [Rhineura floridana]XP_061478678.1 tudor domain-containing protein 15 [Rhineura floridana]